MAKLIIIGGGVSGLSAGIYSLLYGHEVYIYENHSRPGGNLTGWDRQGHHIDNCIHWLTGTNKSTKTYKHWQTLGVLGEGIDTVKQESLYTFCENEQSISLHRDINKLKNSMLEISPADKKEITRLINAVKSIQALCGIGDKADLLYLPLLLRYLYLDAGELAKKFKSDLLKKFISFFLTERFGSLALIFVYAHFCGGNADIPAGGSTAAAQRMADKFRSSGGHLILGNGVVKLIKNGSEIRGAVLSDGQTVYADRFIIAADPVSAMRQLLDDDPPLQLLKMYRDPRLFRFSSVHCAFRYEGTELPFKGDLIIELTNGIAQQLNMKCVTAREFSDQKKYSEKTDGVIQVFGFVDEKACADMISAKAADEGGYKAKKQKIASLFERALCMRMPELENKLSLLDVWTPATYKRYTDSCVGSYMGFAFGAGYVPEWASNKVPGYKNLVLATQWLLPPGGLPTAAESGRYAAEATNKAELKKYGKKSAKSLKLT